MMCFLFRLGSVVTNCHCYYEKNSTVETDLFSTFDNKTNSTNWLNEFQLKPDSLIVKGNQLFIVSSVAIGLSVRECQCVSPHTDVL